MPKDSNTPKGDRIRAANREAVTRVERERVERGVCRHCGGRVPCWSPYGDAAAGVRHTAASLRARERRTP